MIFPLYPGWLPTNLEECMTVSSMRMLPGMETGGGVLLPTCSLSSILCPFRARRAERLRGKAAPRALSPPSPEQTESFWGKKAPLKMSIFPCFEEERSRLVLPSVLDITFDVDLIGSRTNLLSVGLGTGPEVSQVGKACKTKTSDPNTSLDRSRCNTKQSILFLVSHR